MKYNLKNRPKLREFKTTAIWLIALDEWFEGFKKELQQKLKFQSKYHVTDTYGMRIIKEILGK